jgi:hypothetical protein
VAYGPVYRQKPRKKNETTVVAMQWHGNHAPTTVDLLLETMLRNPLLGRCNSWTTTMETRVFSMWSLLRSYHDNWGRPSELSVESQLVKRRLGGWFEMTASLGVELRVDS